MEDREHLEPGEDCWCNPEVTQQCPESLGRDACDPDCWRCAGKMWIAPWSDELSILIVHREDENLIDG